MADDSTASARDAFRARRDRLVRRLWWKLPVIFLLVSFAVWWERPRQQNSNLSSYESAGPEADRLAQNIAGVWQGEAKYNSGETFTEHFFLQPERRRLYGTGSVRGHKRGLENGRIAGDHFSFEIRHDEILGAVSSGRVHRYHGQVDGESIRLRLLDDGTGGPVEFALTKTGGMP